MASRLTIAQTRLSELETQTTALLADPAATTEQIDAHTTAVLAARQELATVQRLVELERTAPATVTVTPPAAQNSSAGGFISATPQAERDPRRGYASVGHYAIDARRTQGIMTGRMSGQISESMRIVIAETERGLRAERDELARIGMAAPTPLHQETQSEDGLLVPPEFRQQIWTPAYEADDLLPFFAPETTASVVVQMVADETTPWGASGIKAYWVGEGKQLTASSLATKPRQIQLHKAGVLVHASDELLQDAPLLTTRINQKAPQAIGWLVSESLIRGNGMAKPLGYEDPAYAGDIAIAKETNQKANTIYTENVLKMAARIIEGPGSRIMWLNHRSTIPQLATLKIGNEPSWTNQNQGLKEAPNGMLLGFPIKFTQHAKTLGTVGDTSLVDFSGYAAFVHSSGTRFDSSIHLYFDFDLTSFRWIVRVGGAPYLSTPVSPADGAETQSHFIQLATRA